MRCLTLCVALLILPVVFAEEKAVTKGVTITAKDGKTSVVFSSKPTEQKVGKIVLHVLEAKDGKSAYFLNQNDLPKDIDLTDKALVKKTFEASRDASLRSMKGKLLSKKDIKLGKLPGYTYDADVAGNVYRARIYLTEKSFVQIAVIGTKEFVDGPEAKKFLDSLKIKE